MFAIEVLGYLIEIFSLPALKDDNLVAKAKELRGQVQKGLEENGIIEHPKFGKIIAFDLKNNRILWKHNINFGADVQPVFLKEKIVVNAEDDIWFDTDYDGNLIDNTSEIPTYIDDRKIGAKKFYFLTHDETPINKEWLQNNKLTNSEFKVEKNQKYTYLLSDTYLTVIGKKGKIKLKINLDTFVSQEEYENEAVSKILKSQDEKVWFLYQNHLIHYNVKKKRVLRDVFLYNWQPKQILLDGKNIWLISKNDGQLYHLEFEPNEELNRKIQEEKAIRDRIKCDPPNPQKVKAAKEAEENLKRK